MSVQLKEHRYDPPFLGGLFESLSSVVENAADDYRHLLKISQTPIKSENEVIERAEYMDAMFDLSQGESDFYFIFANLVADRIEEYEAKYLELPEIAGKEMLALLMKERKVKQSELANITAQGNISAILKGNRTINLDHAKGFSEFFGVPITVFIN